MKKDGRLIDKRLFVFLTHVKPEIQAQILPVVAKTARIETLNLWAAVLDAIRGTEGARTEPDDLHDAELVAKALQIPFYELLSVYQSWWCTDTLQRKRFQAWIRRHISYRRGIARHHDPRIPA